MAERIKFYMDEHVPRAITEGLRRRGVNVLTAQEAGMLAARDEEHLDFAVREGRVIVTQDADFLRLHASSHRHHGIIYAPQRTPTARLINGLMLVFDLLSPEEMDNNIEFV